MCCCSGNKAKSSEQLVQDVVCGMQIEPTEAFGKSEHKGETFYFCAPGCKRKFDADPEPYVK